MLEYLYILEEERKKTVKRYDAYIFDLYGTLVDIHTDEARPLFWKKVAAFYTLQGAPYQPMELHEEYLKLVKDSVKVFS